MRERRGFTLIEILVVVAILAVLLTLLFPAFRFVRVVAYRARCLTNIKQITLAIKEYSVKNNTIPGGSGTSPPFGAVNPTATSKYLNPYLSGNSYRTLECPADQNDRPGRETSYFDSTGSDGGYSYYYIGTGSLPGISPICGAVTWQEYKVGSGATPLNQAEFFKAAGYYNSGPEEDPNPNTRSRDVFRSEIEQAYQNFKAKLAQYEDREGFYLDTSTDCYVSIAKITNVPQSDPSYNTKWPTEYDGSGNPVPKSQRTSGRWNMMSGWSRNIYNYDYWRMPSKKVAVVDRDAVLSFVTPTTNRYPTSGMGFWHEYSYVPDPSSPNDKSKYFVQVHAGFLDGHAAVVEFHKYTTVDRDTHDYY